MSTAPIGGSGVLTAEAASPRAGERPRAPRARGKWTANIGAYAWAGLRFAVAAAFALWIGDVLVLAFGRGRATWAQWLTGVGAALFVAVTTALFVGTMAGPVVVPVVERAGAMTRGWWERLGDSRETVARALAAYGLTLLALAAAAAATVRLVVAWILFGFARPDTVQLAMVGSHLAVAAALALAWPLVLRGARVVVGLAARVSGLRRVLARPAYVGAFFAALLALPGGVLGYVYRAELGSAAWIEVIPVLAAVPVFVAMRRLVALRAPYGPRLGRAFFALAGLAMVGALVATLRVHPESTTAQMIGFDRALSGRLGYAAWVAALDFDRDGQLSVLGGGDCAPFDPQRHTGAPDIPGNRIDEDCDGTDLSATSLRPRARAQVGQAALPQHPSVVLITIDALGGPSLSALGGPPTLMPKLDAFVDGARLFTHCFAQGPSTRLSFPSMFTSRWDSQLTFSYAPRLPYSLGPKEKQLQDLVDDQGYDTVAVIPSSYFDRTRWPSVTRGFAHVDASALAGGKHNAPQVTDAALRMLSEQRARPLYMWVHYYDAHPPYGPVPGATYGARNDHAYYESELTFLDRELGRLLSALEQRPDTYVIVTADHATVFHPNPASRHFHYGYDVYTATLHVPLVVRGPGIKPGRVETLASTMDIAPTILDLLRAADIPRSQGWSLMPELLTDRRDAGRTLFHEYYLPEFILRGKDPLAIVSVRDPRFDLILNRDRGTYELYDWTADYYEQDELYESMAHAPEVAHLRSLLAAFVHEVDDRPDGAGLVPAEQPAAPKTEL